MRLYLGRNVDDENLFTFCFEYFSIGEQEKNGSIIKNPDTAGTKTLNSPGTKMVTKHDFTPKRWIEHLLEIFKLAAVNDVNLAGSVQNQQHFVDILGNIKIHQLRLEEQVLLDVQMLTEKLTYNHLWIDPSRTIENREIKRALIQNLEAFALWEFDKLINLTRFQYLQLDELLLMNSEVIQFHQGIDFSKQLNRFLKLWMNRWNPRCIYMEMMCPDEAGDLNPEQVLRGIHRREQLQESNTVFLNQGRFNFELNLEPFENGYEIRSKDERRALVGFRQVNEVVFQFYLPDQDTEKFM